MTSCFPVPLASREKADVDAQNPSVTACQHVNLGLQLALFFLQAM